MKFKPVLDLGTTPGIRISFVADVGRKTNDVADNPVFGKDPSHVINGPGYPPARRDDNLCSGFMDDPVKVLDGLLKKWPVILALLTIAIVNIGLVNGLLGDENTVNVQEDNNRWSCIHEHKYSTCF